MDKKIAFQSFERLLRVCGELQDLGAHGACRSLGENDQVSQALLQVEGLLREVTGAQTEILASGLREARAAIRGDRSLAELDGPELVDYSSLLDLEVEIVKQQVRAQGTTAEFVAWLLDEVLPVASRVAPVVIRLLS